MIRRGQVHFASLDPVRSREQAGSRPVLVVSSDAINRQPLVVTVVVCTDSANISRDYPVNVRVTAAESGLPRDTVFLCFPGPVARPVAVNDSGSCHTARAPHG